MLDSSTLRETLNGYYKGDLKLFLPLLPTSPEDSTSDAYIRAIESALMGTWLKVLVESLEPLDKIAVAYLCHERWSSFSEMRFVAAHGEMPNFGIFSYYNLDNTLAPLSLLIHGGRIPSDLKPRLREILPSPPMPVLRCDEAFSLTRRMAYSTSSTTFNVTFESPVLDAASAPEEVVNALYAMGTQGLKWTTKTNVLTKKSMLKFKQHGLIAPDYLQSELHWPNLPEAMRDAVALERDSLPWPRAEALVNLICQTNYIGPKRQLSPHAKAMLKGPSHELIKDMWGRWLKLEAFDELDGVNRIKKASEAQSTPVVSRREGIVRGLGQCPVGQWVHIGDLLKYCLATDDFPFVLTHDTEFRLDSRALYKSEEGDDFLIGLAYFMRFIGRYAATLGLVDLALCPPSMRSPHFSQYDPYSDAHLTLFDGIYALRLTPLGAWVLGVSAEYSPPPREVFMSFKFLANGDVVCLEEPDLRTKRVFDTFAHKTAAKIWRVDSASLLTAVNRGEDVQDLLEFFEQTGQTIPGNIRVMMEQVITRSTTTTLLPAHHVVHVKDAILLQEIAHHNKAGKICTPVGPHHLIVPWARLEAFRKALRAMGYALPELG